MSQIKCDVCGKVVIILKEGSQTHKGGSVSYCTSCHVSIKSVLALLKTNQTKNKYEDPFKNIFSGRSFF